jgi:hypothetical protein
MVMATVLSTTLWLYPWQGLSKAEQFNLTLKYWTQMKAFEGE